MTADSVRFAEDFIEFCDGLEAAGQAEYARRGRVVARELIEAIGQLEAARSAIAALRERCEKQQEILGKAVYQAMTRD